jgi:hypothetical protein
MPSARAPARPRPEGPPGPGGQGIAKNILREATPTIAVRHNFSETQASDSPDPLLGSTSAWGSECLKLDNPRRDEGGKARLTPPLREVGHPA